MKNPTTTTRKSDREIVVTRTFDAPARLVFEAWTKAEIFARWWVPKSLGLDLRSCEVDARVGGKYRLVFHHQGNEMAFFGTYLEVIPASRLSWTNEEAGEPFAITTVTFEERDGKTLLALSDLQPTKEAADEAMSGSAAGLGETLQQLADLLATEPSR